MKRLIIDYSTAFYEPGNPSGIPRTVISLTKALLEISHKNIQFVVFNEDKECFENFCFSNNSLKELYHPLQSDVFICLGAPWKHAKYIDTIISIKADIHSLVFLVYDLIPYLFPHFYKDPFFGDYYFNFIKKLISFSNHVVCISKNTREDLLRCTKDDSLKSRISLIELGCEIGLNIKESVTTEFTVKELDKYILCVGTIELRKNQNFLLRIYRNIVLNHNNFPNLVLAGKVAFGNNQIKHHVATDPILRGKVIILDNLSDENLDLVYQRCLFTVYPSLYEGWGLPICESLMYKKNVICSDSSSMTEIAPDLCHHIDPLSYSVWMEKILLLSLDDSYRTEMENNIKNNYKVQTWAKCASQILKII